MAELYIGTKFRTEFARRETSGAEAAEEFLEWCRRWAAAGWIDKAMGNLSFRSENGFIITPTGHDPRTLTLDDLVEVVTVQFLPPVLTVAGRHEPSSESLMHAAIYAARPGIGAVFHGHSEEILGMAELPVTKRERAYGTAAMADEVLDVLGGHSVVIMRNHGFVAVGRTMTEADAAVRRVLARR